MQGLIASTEMRVIVGLGITGLSVARYLARHHRPFIVVDSRDEPPMLQTFRAEFPGVPVHLGSLDFLQWREATEIILSPGVARSTPAIAQALESGIPVVGDIELFAREVDAPFVAITGSNGKTTVTSLVGQMALDAGMNVRVGGNIGTPALDLLEDGVELYVLEISSFQLESTNRLGASVACILNLSEDHMDRYAELHDYMITKQRIYFGAAAIVVNRDDALTRPPMARNTRSTSFGLGEPDLRDFGLRQVGTEIYLANGLKNLMPCSALSLHGMHNTSNALAALALGSAIGIPQDSMISTLRTFCGLAHRCQLIGEKNGIRFYNDSKATNVGATVAAITGLASNPGNVILIAGGDGKGADFSALSPVFEQYLRCLVVIGKDAEAIAAQAGTVPVLKCRTLEEAVHCAFEQAFSGSIVLLSPACASFDMFDSYIDRGNRFTAIAEAIIG